MAEYHHGTGEGAVTPPVSRLPRPVDCAFRLDSLVAVRHEIKAYATAAGLSDIPLYKFVVAVNEIMTNAVHHGGGTGQVRLWLAGDRLICEVTDHGRGMRGRHSDGRQRPQPGTISGWGLWLTREICDEMTIDSDPTGTKVTLQYVLAGPR